MTTDQKYSCTSEFGAEVLMIITSFIILIIFLCRSIQFVIFLIIRIRKRNAIIRRGNTSLFISSAYAISLSLMSYMFSQAKQYNKEGRAEFILIWMVIIEMIRVINSSYSTWELRKSLEQLIRLLWVGFLVCSYTPLQGIRSILLFLCIYYALVEVFRGCLFYQTKESYLIGKNSILINNYVKRLMLLDDLQTTPMHCCKYIVMGEENHKVVFCGDGCFPGEKISNTEGMLTIGRVFELNSPEDEVFTSAFPNWRDNCLSFALAKMLRRRFDKVPLEEAGCKMALDFVLEGLIDYIGSNLDIQIDGNDEERNPIERVFSIIRYELNLVSNFSNINLFTHDYNWQFYSFYAMRIIIMLCIGVYLIIYAISKGSSAWVSLVGQEAYNDCFFHVFRRGPVVVEIFYRLDQAITLLLVSTLIYIQCIGIVSFIVSKHWFNLKHVKRYIKDPAKWNRSYSSLGASKSSKLVYQKARVYSSVLDAEAETILFCIKVDVSILARLPKWIRRNIPRSTPTLVHSTDAKRAILRFFRNSGGRLSNGETSLKNYGMEHLNWACQPNGSTTEAILIWHIATTLLFHHQEHSPQQNNVPQQKKEQEVAVALSNYCHYLVMYFSELLPDDVDWTEEMYVRVRKEILPIAMLFDHKPTKKERCNYALWAIWVESSLVGKGAMLSKDLMKCAEDGSHVWTMLAEFWAEIMLFIAPSDNVDGHEKILDQEELITQLWALLTHAGILTRPKPTEHRNHESESNAGTGDMNV